MLAKLEMKLDQKEGMTSQMSSSMHGAFTGRIRTKTS